MDEVIVYLTIDGELIETTPEHPFYTDDGEWVDAIDLSVGELILSLDGDYGAVEAIEVIDDADQRMYNLTVDEAHTFYVGDGEWLVHNADWEQCGVEKIRYGEGLSEYTINYRAENDMLNGRQNVAAIRLLRGLADNVVNYYRTIDESFNQWIKILGDNNEIVVARNMTKSGSGTRYYGSIHSEHVLYRFLQDVGIMQPEINTHSVDEFYSELIPCTMGKFTEGQACRMFIPLKFPQYSPSVKDPKLVQYSFEWTDADLEVRVDYLNQRFGE